MSIEIAFFKADKGSWDDKAIDLLSGRVGYSHCEFVIDSQTTIGAHQMYNGVHKFTYGNIHADPRWDVITLTGDRNRAIEYAYKQIGRPYDLVGGFLHLIHLPTYASKDGVWCSELVMEIVNEANRDEWIRTLKTELMPNQAYITLQQNAHVNSANTQLASDELAKLIINTIDREIDRYGRLEIAD